MTPKQIIIHHTVSSRDKTTLKDVDNWHRVRWWWFKSSLGYYVGYHYLITGDGTVHQTRQDNEEGAHLVPNHGRIGIGLTGNFMIEKPSEAQIKALEILTERLKIRYNIRYVQAHREFERSLCPGTELFKWVLKQRISWLRWMINKLFGR